ncbi:MAG: hypothetical protein KatS3mg083_047 [Candidatus Dojkabacteria bacterium]|nr:MAG: hypothetical protein KatS3mg083_047 [Candidatus Dojkabacteria bacterium]
MIIEIGQILGFLVSVIFVYVIIITILKPIVFRFAVFNLIKQEILSLLILFCLVIVSTALSFILSFSYSYNSSIQETIDKRLGNVQAIIYSNNKRYSLSEINAIYNQIHPYFDKYLPVSLAPAKYRDIDVLITYFDPSIAEFFEPRIKADEFPDLESNQIAIPKTFADKENLRLGDKINIIINDKHYELVVRDIIDDNGVVGFTKPVKSSLRVFESNIIVAESFIKQLYEDSIYNTVLLGLGKFSLADIDFIDRKIQKFDSNLIFEELSQSYLESLSGGGMGLSLSQLMFIAVLPPMLMCLGVSLLVLNWKLNKNIKEFAILRSFGVSSNDIISIIFIEIVIYSIVSSISGLLISYLGFDFIKAILVNLLNIQNQFILDLSFKFDLSNWLIVVFASIGALVLVLFLGVVNLPKIFTQFDLTKNYQFVPEKTFKLKDNYLILFGLLICFLAAYYVFIGYISDQELSKFIIFLVFQIALWLIALIFVKVFNRWDFRVLLAVTLINVIVNTVFFELSFFEDIRQKYQILAIIPAMILTFTLAIFFPYLLGKISIRWITFDAAFKLIYKNMFFAVFTIWIMIVIFVFSSLLESLREQTLQSFKDVSVNYDLVATDEYGLANSYDILDQLKQIPEISDITLINSADVEFADTTYAEFGLQKFADDNNLDPQKEIRGILSVIDFQQINTEIVWDTKFSDPINEFLKNNSYVVLGYNFLQNDQNSSSFNIGDKVKIRFKNDQIIERIVIGYIANDTKRPSNELFISPVDYNFLRDSNPKVRFAALYGIKVHTSTDINNLEILLRQKFIDSFNRVFRPAQNISDVSAVILQLIEYMKVYFRGIIFIILIVFVIASYSRMFTESRFYAIRRHHFIYITLWSQLVLLFISAVLAIISHSYIISKFSNLWNISINYDSVFNGLLRYVLILAIVVLIVAVLIWVIDQIYEKKQKTKFTFK